ncbi:hypothetical protein P154DRAFT_597556 [Amniculicola lignicola CBS 123094]|uniref:Uncharacterized protein n=1 Tax=Amniculicola lignicola CBS 123094 TaxID=1392246 RepID=A0A6A5WZ06_9PLEO|nr:hypothetical protein P154DRAFT_597556 [Amniculicola lignicola CBS 123094]
MERTPSPPPRLRTPPAPLHGAQFDGYEPYSPRRSNRVTSRPQYSPAARPKFLRRTRETTPTSSKKKAVPRTSFSTLSPPSSPISPAKHKTPRSTRRTRPDLDATDTGFDDVAPTPSSRSLTAMDPRSMLPTPAKTPRKRALQTEESLSSTSRVLFQDRPATISDIVPVPRRGRKSRKDLFSLDSFGDHMDEDEGGIQIYTDSKERVPEIDEDDENPFITKKGKGKAKVAATPKPRKVDPETAKMEEAASRNEGMIYLFRGRKVFRKYEPAPGNDAVPASESSGDELRRKVGHAAHRPLTRSSIKPRRLFQEEIEQQRLARQDAEEATTDTEAVVATPSRKMRKMTHVSAMVQPDVDVEVGPATPPPTTRRKRGEC